MLQAQQLPGVTMPHHLRTAVSARPWPCTISTMAMCSSQMYRYVLLLPNKQVASKCSPAGLPWVLQTLTGQLGCLDLVVPDCTVRGGRWRCAKEGTNVMGCLWHYGTSAQASALFVCDAKLPMHAGSSQLLHTPLTPAQCAWRGAQEPGADWARPAHECVASGNMEHTGLHLVRCRGMLHMLGCGPYANSWTNLPGGGQAVGTGDVPCALPGKVDVTQHHGSRLPTREPPPCAATAT